MTHSQGCTNGNEILYLYIIVLCHLKRDHVPIAEFDTTRTHMILALLLSESSQPAIVSSFSNNGGTVKCAEAYRKCKVKMAKF